jgi:hypothetical protein
MMDPLAPSAAAWLLARHRALAEKHLVAVPQSSIELQDDVA